jgi:hypothetical protein
MENIKVGQVMRIAENFTGNWDHGRILVTEIDLEKDGSDYPIKGVGEDGVVGLFFPHELEPLVKSLTLPSALSLVQAEVEQAISKYPPFNSAHEGWAILREELDELWDEVKKSPKTRSVEKMHEEVVQVAAMAVRFLLDVTE